MEDHVYKWCLMLLDSSRVATLLVSVLLIVYGCFRSLGVDAAKENEFDNSDESSKSVFFFQSISPDSHTISSTQAMLLPLGASCSLLFMFFFFDKFQSIFAVCTVVLGTIAFSFLLFPLCQYAILPLTNPNYKISFGSLGRFTHAELLAIICSIFLVGVWMFTGHWILMDAMAMGLCISMISYLRLPSLKVSIILLLGLVFYDVFWVYFSAYLFKDNVMVKVATQPANNPISFVDDKIGSTIYKGAASNKHLSLPGKLVFPSYSEKGRMSMLGLGDIVMPGLLLSFVLRFDNHKQKSSEETKIKYFHCSLIGYFVGLLGATIVSEVYQTAQPALLFLVPSTLLPVLVIGYLQNDLKEMWSNPFGELTCKLRQIEI
ncbi:signal peptide peptidase-like 3 [Xenia sp. Carnegie-2017]|uniref:signal peptide peptidase-like 3 n=1 Tax=Xenia sp. Carnegie-2017 TaxID=2897299 RepID=UPI001F04F3AC|nr:signal peptide peptidase-like 3 [Xenia sp. Carnegie-2017]XP_046839971.1 signal peptide peptidase-like 3 [Xenia sp. Carnegie-2017]